MLTAESALLRRLAPIQMVSRRDKVLLCLIAILHLTALGIMAATEVDLVARITFLLVWALLNFFWLTLFRRPLVAAIISLEPTIMLNYGPMPAFDPSQQPRTDRLIIRTCGECT